MPSARSLFQNSVVLKINYFELNYNNNNNNNNGRNGCLTWLATSLEERRRWPIMNASPRGQCSKEIYNLEGKAYSDEENRASQLVG